MDVLGVPNYLDESIGNNIGFLRNEGDHFESLNKSLEISVVTVNGDKGGKLNDITESSLALQLCDVGVKKETVEDPYIEVEIEEKKYEAEPLIIIKDISAKASGVIEVNEDFLEIKPRNTVKHEVGRRKRYRESAIKSVEGTIQGVTEHNVITNMIVKSESDISEELQCSSCRKILPTSADFHQHMEIHKRENIHQCTYCNKTFKQLNHLNMHKQIHLGKCSFQCELCLETFKHKSSLNSHMKKHFGVKDFSCDLCSAAFHCKYELKIHMIKHTGELPHKCKECGDEFPIASRLRRHMMIHTGERPFQCEVCGIVFREHFTLNAHMGVHLPRGPYPCDICGEEFSRLNGLTLHRRVHNTDDTYSYVPQKHTQKINSTDSVSMQSPSHRSPSAISVHDEPELKINFLTSVETNSESKVPDCTNTETSLYIDQELPQCESDADAMTEAKVGIEKGLPEADGTSVPHPSVVQEALSTGTLLESQADDGKGYLIVLPKSLVERNYTLFTVCPPPGAVKSQDTEDEVISRKNEEVLENNCNLFVCDNSLDSLAEIPPQQNQEGIAEEALIKPKKSKKQKDCLSDISAAIGNEFHPKKMERSPTKKKPKKKKTPLIGKLHRCHQCGKDYKTSSNLNIHMRTHTGERPYYCDFCGLGFKQLAHLQSHVRIHTGENPYQCDLCDQAFNQSSRLTYHMRSVHFPGRKKKSRIVKQCTIRNFYCKICDNTFLDSCFKKNHMKTHANDMKYKRVKCASKGKLNLKKTQEFDVNDEWGMCELCGIQYKDITAMNLHKRELHGVTEDDLEMPSKQSHSNIHMDDDQLNNEVIPTSDLQIDSLPEACVDTRLVTNSTTKSSLASPKNVISNIKALKDGKYECCVCNKIFNTRSNARVHLRLHSDDRPYKCNDCGRAFRQISHLKDHIKMHTGEKPFKCSICPAAFSQSSGVKVHIKKYHSGKAFAINDQKEKNVVNQDSIVFENLPQTHDTVIINIESGKSVSVEHKQFNEESCSANNEQCDLCGKSFLSRYMKFHMRTHKKLSYKCIVCRKLHKKYELLSNNRNKERKQYICNKCESAGTHSLGDFSQVVDTSTVQARQQDELNDSVTLRNNIASVSEYEDAVGLPRNIENSETCLNPCAKEVKHICNLCNKHFKRKSSLNFHKKFSHRVDKCITDIECSIGKVKNRIKETR